MSIFSSGFRVTALALGGEARKIRWKGFDTGYLQWKPSTPWKFNIAPENGWLEDEFPFGIPYFQGLC